MKSETRNCQSCKQPFIIEPDDFGFYEKMQVPAPTWCPECRMVRRMIWRNEHNLFRRPDTRTNKEIFSMFHREAPVTVYDVTYWLSDNFDPMAYGRDYDFSKPFFVQLKELFETVPVPSRSVTNVVNSDYSMNVSGAKNAYLCFGGLHVEDSAYVIGFNHVTSGFDLYQSRHSESCYDCYMVDESNKVFYSTNCEESHDVWFSKNMVGCMNCFGCINLRNKSYHIFNEPVSKEVYQEFMDAFQSGSHRAVEKYKQQAHAFWLKYPNRFTLTINVVNSNGEHIEHSKNTKDSYFVHDGENLRYCQLIEDASDSYDYTAFGDRASRVYETTSAAVEVDNIKFCWNCLVSSTNEEYSIQCRSSNNNFGCVGLKKNEYCILNKQYSKEDYLALREKIITHMSQMPYTDSRGRVYTYGEFFPPEFTPFAYNETIAQDFFPLTKEQALAQGYRWRESELREFKATFEASALPDDIADVKDDIVKDIITCSSCTKAYRIIKMELDFLRRVQLPIPRRCPECRFKERFAFVNPPTLWHAKCQCSGAKDERGMYQNAVKHPHGDAHCPVEFETSYKPGRPEIIYCERCYQAEVV